MTEDWFEALTWDAQGLLPVIAQDSSSGEVLMMAWMNPEALALSCERGYAVYWSRSRQALWFKGAVSGHCQKIVEMRIDCDMDVVLLRVIQQGGIACHTGRRRCFYRVLKAGQWLTDEEIIKDPTEIYP